MKKLFAVCMLLSVVTMTFVFSAVASAENYQLKMWIAPLECTRSEVVDGVTVTTIITPEECNDLLNPPAGPTDPKPNPGGTPAPQAPDTGVFSDIWTSVAAIGILVVVLGSILYILLRETWLSRLRNRNR